MNKDFTPSKRDHKAPCGTLVHRLYGCDPKNACPACECTNLVCTCSLPD